MVLHEICVLYSNATIVMSCLVFSFIIILCVVKAVAAPITVLYFWSFVIIAYFVLFNMVLAVIFTVYDEEYGDLKKELKLEEAESKRIAQLVAKDTKKVK